MPQLLQLEEFEAPDQTTPADFFPRSGSRPAAAPSDTGQMASYEKGYTAGYDDAAAAASAEQTHISTEFAHNLEDLRFTFHEARSHVMRSLEPLLMALVEKLLPDLVAQTIGQRILEEITPMAEQASDTPIQIVVAPGSRAVLEPLLTNSSTCPLVINEEPSLGPGQVFLRSGKFEKHIDLEQAINAVSQAIEALDQDGHAAFAHG